MISINKEKCDDCGTCVSVCPTAALMISERLEVDQPKCIACGACVKICPFAALHLETNVKAAEAAK